MPAGPPTLAVLIPTLNEERALGSLLDDLRQQQGIALELLVADGGSQDRTRQLAEHAGARCCLSPAGRGRQLNVGRQELRAPWLLVLHADSRLHDPHLLANALAHMQQQPANCAGHFPLIFHDTAGVSPRLIRHMQAKTRLNRPGCINGDQGLLLRRDFLEQLGGFDERWHFLEDQAISERIFAHGDWVLLPGQLHTSARRFTEEGDWQRYFIMMLIMCAREAGVDAFFSQARQLYPQQSKTRALKVLPFLDLLLQLGETNPQFWQAMARYARANTWQLAFLLDRALGGQHCLNWLDRHPELLGSRFGDALLARGLRLLFRGPVRRLIREIDRHPPS